MRIHLSEMEAHLLSLVIQNWYFIYRYNLLQIYAQVCSTWTFCNFKTYLTARYLTSLITVLNRSLTMDVVSSNSCKNKEYILIGQIFDQTLSIFQFLNVRLQHKNGRTCPMTDRYLHHCSNKLVIPRSENIGHIIFGTMW